MAKGTGINTLPRFSLAKRPVLVIPSAAVCFALLSALVVSGSALASDQAICRNGADERVVRVRTPGVVGAVCDVSYLQDFGAWESVPFHANTDAGACAAEARALVAKLSADGFTCAGALVSPQNTIADAPPTDKIDVAASDQRNANAEQPADPVRLKLDTLETKDDEAATELIAVPLRESSLRDDPLLDDRPRDESRFDQLDREGEARLWRATNSPVDLTATLTPISTAVPVQRRAKTAGRIMGAAVAEVAAPEPAPVIPNEPAGVLASLEIVDAAGVASASTAPLEALRSALAQQAAAWRRGDMDAFRNGFVAVEPTAATALLEQPTSLDVAEGAADGADGDDDAGFEPFAALYDAKSAKGALNIRVASAEMVSADTARVYGALSLENASSNSDVQEQAIPEGFSVIMRKIGETWRIERP